MTLAANSHDCRVLRAFDVSASISLLYFPPPDLERKALIEAWLREHRREPNAIERREGGGQYAAISTLTL